MAVHRHQRPPGERPHQDIGNFAVPDPDSLIEECVAAVEVTAKDARNSLSVGRNTESIDQAGGRLDVPAAMEYSSASSGRSLRWHQPASRRRSSRTRPGSTRSGSARSMSRNR